MSGDLVQRKASLRLAMRAARDALPSDIARAASAAASAHLCDLVADRSARRVALYAAMRGELDATPAALELARRGVELSYPRVVGRRLTFHVVAGVADLRPGRLGILEPTPAHAEIDPAELELVVAPGLAFDDAGGRLGWGGGYYDEVLARAPGVTSVGLCFALQRVAEVPCSPTDARVDLLISEDGLRRTSRCAP